MDLTKDLELSYSMVYAEHITDTVILDQLIAIKSKCERILRFATQFDLDSQHPYNGYRSAVLFVVKFFFAVHCTKLNESFDGTTQEVELICRALNKTLDQVLEFYQDTCDDQRERLAPSVESQSSVLTNGSSTSGISCASLSTASSFKSMSHSSTVNAKPIALQRPITLRVLLHELEAMDESHVPFIYNKYYEFFYKGTLKNLNQTLLSTFSQNFDPWSWFKTLSNSTLGSTSLLLNAMHLNSFKSMFNGAQSHLAKNWLPFLASNSFPFVFERVSVPRQLDWLICPITFQLRHNPFRFQVRHQSQPISCWLLRNTVNSSGHLLIYIFPPTLFGTQFELSNCFLRDWSVKLPGCSILIPQFEPSTNSRFPCWLQDSLDVYLWAVAFNSSSDSDPSTTCSLSSTSTHAASNSSTNVHSHLNHHLHQQLSASNPVSGASNGSTSVSNPTSDAANEESGAGITAGTTCGCTNDCRGDNERILGGSPESIILAGDSSGGNLAAALTLVINDMRQQFACTSLQMPAGLVLAYSPLNLRDYSPIMLTSRFNYSLSPLISLTMIESQLPLPSVEHPKLIDSTTLPTPTSNIGCATLVNSSEKSSTLRSDTLIRPIRRVHQVRKRPKKVKSTASTVSGNNYFVDRFNRCKLSDFFPQFRDDFGNSDDFGDELSSSSSNDSKHRRAGMLGRLSGDGEDESDDELGSNEEEDDDDFDTNSIRRNSEDSTSIVYDSSTGESEASENEINFGRLKKYFTSTISNYISLLNGSQDRLRLQWLDLDQSNSAPLNGEAVSTSANVLRHARRATFGGKCDLVGPSRMTAGAPNKSHGMANRLESDGLLGNALTMFKELFNGEKKAQKPLNNDLAIKCFTGRRREAFLKLTSCPYVSPGLYDRFDQLGDVSLFLLNSTCDMYLDDNICMAKKWKGTCDLGKCKPNE